MRFQSSLHNADRPSQAPERVRLKRERHDTGRPRPELTRAPRSISCWPLKNSSSAPGSSSIDGHPLLTPRAHSSSTLHLPLATQKQLVCSKLELNEVESCLLGFTASDWCHDFFASPLHRALGCRRCRHWT